MTSFLFFFLVFGLRSFRGCLFLEMTGGSKIIDIIKRTFSNAIKSSRDELLKYNRVYCCLLSKYSR